MNKLLKGMIALACTLAMVGCSSGGNSKANELYGGLDAKATYEKAIKYFNDNVHYAKYTSKNIYKGEQIGVDIAEKFKENDKYNYITRSYYNSDTENCNVNLAKDEKYANLFYHSLNENKKMDLQNENGLGYWDKYQKEQYVMYQYPFFSNLYEDTENIDYKRTVVSNELNETSDGTISFTIQFNTETTRDSYNEETGTVDQDKKVTDYNYYTTQFTIGTDGFISSYNEECYSDNERKTLKWIYETELSEINEKTTFDYDEEYSKLKALDNKTAQDVLKVYPDLKFK